MTTIVRTMGSPDTVSSETVSLCFGWAFDDQSNGTPILSKLFGEMVKRATPVVEAYTSDLAEWLRKNDTGLAWQLQGSYGRAARDFIEAGLCTLPGVKA